MSLDILNLDLRPIDTEHAISALRKYVEVMEAQIEEVHHCERVALDAERPHNGDEEERRLFWNQEQALEALFEQDLAPAMRYTFILLLHTVFETRLRAFCTDIQKERGIPVSLADMHGSPIDKARIYLTKLAALGVADFPEWQQLRTIQKVRDCIVHGYGYVAESRSEKELRQLVGQNTSLTIDDCGRLALTKAFCDEYLTCLDRFFHGLFRAVGWRS